MSELYETIGRGYAAYRRPDARVAAALAGHLLARGELDLGHRLVVAATRGARRAASC